MRERGAAFIAKTTAFTFVSDHYRIAQVNWGDTACYLQAPNERMTASRVANRHTERPIWRRFTVRQLPAPFGHSSSLAHDCSRDHFDSLALSGIEPQIHSMRFPEVRFQTGYYATVEAHIENIGHSGQARHLGIESLHNPGRQGL